MSPERFGEIGAGVILMVGSLIGLTWVLGYPLSGDWNLIAAFAVGGFYGTGSSAFLSGLRFQEAEDR